MNKEKLKELEAIYEQKRATCIWVEDLLRQAMEERQAAFRAWREAIKKSKAQP